MVNLHLLRYIVFGIVVMMLLSCGGGGSDGLDSEPTPETPVPTLSISPASPVAYTASGGTTTVTVTTNQSSWNASSNQGWCEVAEMDKIGKTFKIKAASHTSENAKTPATVTVTAGSAQSKTISVTQEGLPIAPEITLDASPKTPIRFPAEGGLSDTITVTTNAADWSVVSSQAWCQVVEINKSANRFRIKADGHTSTTAPAPATVTVSATGAPSVVIEVTQEAAEETVTPGTMLEVSPKTPINFPASGGTTAIISVTTDASDWNVFSAETWCKVVDIDKTANTFKVSADAHTSPTAPPQASVLIQASGAPSVVIFVTQDAYSGTPGGTLTVIPSAPVHFYSAGGSTTLMIITNQSSWDVVSDQSWCKVYKDVYGSSSLTIQASACLSHELPLPATVTITAGTAPPVQVMVTQNPSPTLSLTPSDGMFFPAKGGNRSVTVSSNISDWRVECDKDWCEVKRINSTTFTISVARNTATTSPAPATITVYADNKSGTIVLTQDKAASDDAFGNEDVKYDDHTEWD